MIGSADGLQFELTLGTGPRMDLAWGLGRVRLQGRAVWSGEDAAGQESALRWTWFDLLEFLARHWPWLHGPAILLNQAPSQSAEQVKSSTLYRERSTLAHEICHLLIDRERALTRCCAEVP